MLFTNKHINIQPKYPGTESVLDIEPTSLRLDPQYIYYYVHWTRLITTGLVPMIYIASVNILIFIMIQRQSRDWRLRKMSVVSSVETRRTQSSNTRYGRC